MKELLSCPFCGSEARYYAPGPIDHHIECINYKECGADIARDTKVEAIEAWNTRAERTCHDEGDPSDFCCSECGARMFTDVNDTYTMIANDEQTVIKHPNYCPNCGAKVMD